MACGLMAYGLGRGKRKTEEEEEAGSANCFSRLPNFASLIVWIIAHRFEFASQVGIPTPLPDSFLPFWLFLICVCFFVLFHGFFVVSFKKQSRRVVVKKIPFVCLDLLLQNRFSATYLFMCFSR